MKTHLIPRWWRPFLIDQDGATAIVIALLFPVFLGFAGLAVDIGHIYAIDSQLKNAADAGALSGAGALVPYYSGMPRWGEAETKATETVKRNYYDANKYFTDSEVAPGYWNFATNTFQGKDEVGAPTADDYPAVRVKISKTAGKNGGPVPMFLASALGVLSADRSATSVAIISFPMGMKAGGLKPMVATKDIVEKYWDWPKGTPVTFKLGDGKTAEDTMWTTFLVSEPSDQANATTLSRTLIQEGNPDPIYSVSPSPSPSHDPSSIYLQPGVEATLYGDATGEKITGMGDFINQTVVLPVVNVDDLTAKQQADVQGFIAFHITNFNQGGRYIEGYFDKDYTIENPQMGSSNVPTNPYSIAISPQLVY